MNSKQIATTATLAATVLAGISVSTNVHADKVSSNGGNARQNAQAPWQARLSQAQQVVNNAQDNLISANATVSTAQGNVMSAQKQLKSAQSAVNDQRAVVNSAQMNVNSASAATSSAQQTLDSAKSLASSPADIAKTKQETIDHSKQVQSDQIALKNAKSALAESNKKVTAAQDQVTTVKGQQSVQQAIVASVKQNRDQANTALSESKRQVTESQNALTIAQNSGATAKNSVKTAETALASAQQARDTAAKNIESDESKVQTAQTDVKTAQDAQQQVAGRVAAANTQLSQDQAELDAAKQAVTTAEQSVKKAQDNVNALKNALPTFNFTADQIAATQALAKEIADDIANNRYFGTYSIQNANTFQNWANVMTNSQLAESAKGWTDNIEKDVDETVDLKNITDAQVNELSIFTAELLNKIANQLGISDIVSKEVATVGASEIAGEVARMAAQDDITSGHYIYALHQAYYDHGLSTTQPSDSEKQAADVNEYGESLSTYFSTNLPSQMSMAEVKEQLVQGIAGMIFADMNSNMGHTISMCGLDTIGNANRKQIIGVAPSFAKSRSFNAISFHINQPDAYELDSSNPKQAGLTDPIQKRKPSDGKAELAQAQATLVAKQKDVTTKQATVDADNMKLTQLNESLTDKKRKTQQAQTQLDVANTALKRSQEALANAQNNITTANSDLKKAKAHVQTAKQNVAMATQNLAQVQQAQKDKQTALDNAQAELNKEQIKLDNIDQLLKTQQSKLIATQQDYAAKQSAVNDAAQRLAKSQAQAKNLHNQLQAMQAQAQAVQKAQADLNETVNVLTDAQQELQKQQDTLAQLKKTASDNQAKLTNAQATLKEAQIKANTAANVLTQAKTELANAQPDSVKYGKQVKIKPVVMTIGDNIPNPIIVNSNVVVNVPEAQSLVLMAANQDQLPASTIAKWANLDQVKRDAAEVGAYAEDVLVAFPDTSTYTVRGVSLIVNPVPTKPAQPSEQPAQPSEQPAQPSEQPAQPSEQPAQPSEQPTQPSEQPAQPSEQPAQPSEQPAQPSEQPTQQGQATELSHSGSAAASTTYPNQDTEANTTLMQSVTNAQVSSEGKATGQNAGILSKDGKLCAAPTNVSTTQTKATDRPHKQGTTDQQLPQTGNDTSSVLSLIGLAFTAALAMFGIEKHHN